MKTALGNPWGDGGWSTNTSGFGALPEGLGKAGTSLNINLTEYFISTLESDASDEWNQLIGSGTSTVAHAGGLSGNNKSYGFSVRVCRTDSI